MLQVCSRLAIAATLAVALVLTACEGGPPPVSKEGRLLFPDAAFKCDEFGTPYLDISGGELSWSEKFAVGCYVELPPGFVECYREELPGLRHVAVCAYCHPEHPGITFWNFGCVLPPQGCFIRSSVDLADWIEMVRRYRQMLDLIQQQSQGGEGLPQLGCLTGPKGEFAAEVNWDGRATLSTSALSPVAVKMPPPGLLGEPPSGVEFLVNGLPASAFAGMLLPAGIELQVIGDAPAAIFLLGRLGLQTAAADDGSSTVLFCPVLPVVQVFEGERMTHLMLVTPDGVQELPLP